MLSSVTMATPIAMATKAARVILRPAVAATNCARPGKSDGLDIRKGCPRRKNIRSGQGLSGEGLSGEALLEKAWRVRQGARTAQSRQRHPKGIAVGADAVFRPACVVENGQHRSRRVFLRKSFKSGN